MLLFIMADILSNEIACSDDISTEEIQTVGFKPKFKGGIRNYFNEKTRNVRRDYSLKRLEDRYRKDIEVNRDKEAAEGDRYSKDEVKEDINSNEDVEEAGDSKNDVEEDRDSKYYVEEDGDSVYCVEENRDNKYIEEIRDCNEPAEEDGYNQDNADVVKDSLFGVEEDEGKSPATNNEELGESSCIVQQLPNLEELANSDYIHNRQLAARKILESLQQAGSNDKELHSVIAIMCKLSEDEEAMVRLELMQHIPSIALYYQNDLFLRIVIRQQLIPYTVKLLTDPQIMPQIRKSGQAALLVLLENNLIDQSQLTEWICPLISQLVICDKNLEEMRAEDVSLMSKMIPLVGRETTLKFFLEPYISLCSDSSYGGIRRFCALGFGTLCKVVGVETTEQSLLPAFLNLCNDEMWGVRKACTEVFVDVSNSVTPKTRREVLPDIFDNLLTDNSSYVKCGAYQNLGGFIHTFSDGYTNTESELTGETVHVEAQPIFLHFRTYSSSKQEDRIYRTHKMDSRTNFDLKNPRSNSSDLMRSLAAKDKHVYLHVEYENLFNNFQFWRVPIPEVELDADIEEDKATNNHIRAKVQDVPSAFERRRTYHDSQSFPKPSIKKTFIQTSCINTFSTLEHQSLLDDDAEILPFKESVLTFKDSHLLEVMETISSNSDLIEDEKMCTKMTIYDQDIVPPALLGSFISAVQQSLYDMRNDDEKAGYIAYSFPAVVFTLGPKYWPCIRDTLGRLAQDMKWTVRRIVASSLHELANILGYEIIITDLLPIFTELLKDVDEVRLRLVEHLSEFLQHLTPQDRRQFLPLVQDFTKVDNDNNWRFRWGVAEQLRKTVDLYESLDIPEYFLPVASTLLHDKVSTVRLSAVELMAILLKRLHHDSRTDSYFEIMLDSVDNLYRQSPKWISRQTYIRLCEELVNKESMPIAEYAERIVPNLLSLAFDRVPNVRLALMRCIVMTLLPKGVISNITSPSSHQLLLKVVDSMRCDLDYDVRHFAYMYAPNKLSE